MSKATEIKVTDKYNTSKQHCFRFYTDGHVTYNQRIDGIPFYSRWQRVNSKFGYAEYLTEAKIILNSKEVQIVRGPRKGEKIRVPADAKFFELRIIVNYGELRGWKTFTYRVSGYEAFLLG